MKVIFDERILKKVYLFLNNVQDLDKEEKENYNQTEEVTIIKNDLDSSGSYPMGPSELPSPLKSISFSVRKVGNFYEAYTSFLSRMKKNCFNNLSEVLEKNPFESFSFVSTCPHGGGYLIKNSNEKQADYVLTYSDIKQNHVLSLVFGNSGSKLRNFGGKYEDFLIDIKAIEKVTNNVLSRIYISNNITISQFKDLEILVS